MNEDDPKLRLTHRPRNTVIIQKLPVYSALDLVRVRRATLSLVGTR